VKHPRKGRRKVALNSDTPAGGPYGKTNKEESRSKPEKCVSASGEVPVSLGERKGGRTFDTGKGGGRCLNEDLTGTRKIESGKRESRRDQEKGGVPRQEEKNFSVVHVAKVRIDWKKSRGLGSKGKST